MSLEPLDFSRRKSKKGDDCTVRPVSVSTCEASDLVRSLSVHITEFDKWREEWTRYRDEAQISMHRVSMIEPAMKIIADNIGYLECLPNIQEQIKVMNVGLAAQNSALIGQADKLIGPAQRSQYIIYNLLAIMILMAGIVLAILLLRETTHGFEAGPFKMTSSFRVPLDDAK